MSTPAERFDALFQEVYLTYHRRDGPRSELSGATRAVLRHLMLTGPVTITDLTAHLQRAQSVVSEIVSHLERDGLVEREPDPEDRRRTLVWVSDAGRGVVAHDQRVLSQPLLDAGFGSMPAATSTALLDGLRTLIDHAPRGRHDSNRTTQQDVTERTTRT